MKQRVVHKATSSTCAVTLYNWDMQDDQKIDMNLQPRLKLFLEEILRLVGSLIINVHISTGLAGILLAQRRQNVFRNRGVQRKPQNGAPRPL
jgi:hypothetical protein